MLIEMHLKSCRTKNYLPFIFAIAVVIMLLAVVPMPHFDNPTSTVVLSSDGNMLGARIADDGQWRFPESNELPEKYTKALIAYEDARFRLHNGIDMLALCRAFYLNVRHRSIVSGGSTISMQVARLSRKNPKREIFGKMLEMCMAFKLELFHSKDYILRQYASSAPFGGNVVGIDAASWRYFNSSPKDISWAEAAMLAVLPNAPSLMHPGKNQAQLKLKRDKLLQKLNSKGLIDDEELTLSLLEPLPLEPKPLPSLAPHITDKIAKTNRGECVTTTIDSDLQTKVNLLSDFHNKQLRQNDVNNIAAVIVDVEDGHVLAWVGNSPGQGNNHGSHVDIVTSNRSSGSILKPLLFAAMLQSGDLLPDMLIPDLPIDYSGYSPKNFDYGFSGAVPASQALSRSLNIPSVVMLHEFGVARFLDLLRNVGFTTLGKSPDHYGLSLILGGGEVSLFEIAGVYSSLSRVLSHYSQHSGYSNADFFMPKFVETEAEQNKKINFDGQPLLSASSIWFTFKAMQEVNRPDDRAGWRHFSSSGNVAWKTGTSFGFRDAWAVAVTPRYVVAVWAGNADGTGRPGITGTLAAAPLLFDILDLLPKDEWFEKPYDEIVETEICSESGYKAMRFCKHKNLMEVPVSGLQTSGCPFHRVVHLSHDKQWQVDASCYPISDMVVDSMFILPPGMEWFYKRKHPWYRTLPKPMKGCMLGDKQEVMEFLYPNNMQKIYIPRELDGSKGKVVFEVVHRNEGAHLFWYIDEELVAETDYIHQIASSPAPGEHIITLVDSDGFSLSKKFTVEY